MLRDDRLFGTEKMRTDLWMSFRIDHGSAIKQDRSTKNDMGVVLSSAELGLRQHVRYATGEWCKDIMVVIEKANGSKTMWVTWKVLEPVDGGEDFKINIENLKMLALMVRSFSGQHCHCMILWWGWVAQICWALSSLAPRRYD